MNVLHPAHFKIITDDRHSFVSLYTQRKAYFFHRTQTSQGSMRKERFDALNKQGYVLPNATHDELESWGRDKRVIKEG